MTISMDSRARGAAALCTLALSLAVCALPAHHAVAAGLQTRHAHKTLNVARIRNHALPAGVTRALRSALTGGAAPSTTWTEEAELTAPDAHSNAQFAWAVAISGTTAAVSAPTNGTGGAVYVFVRSGTTWTEQQEITATGTQGFGIAVALSGNTLVVGAPFVNLNTGAAYVFVRSGTTWSQQAELKAARGMPINNFGQSVSVSGNAVVIGTANTGTGSAYIFVRSGTRWLQEATLTTPGGATGDLFGYAVAVNAGSGTVAVAAPVTNSDTGAVYVFVRNGTTWSEQTELTAADGAANDRFGNVVSLSGNTLLVGAPGKTSYTGAAYMFVRNGSTWSQQQEIAAPASSGSGATKFFGSAVAVSGQTAVIGASTSNNNIGAAFVYASNGSAWSQQAALTAPDISPTGHFGNAVAVSGGIAIVGADGNSTAAGSAYVFVRS